MEDRRTGFPALPGRRVCTAEMVGRSYCLKEVWGYTLERPSVRCSVRSTPEDRCVYKRKTVPVYAVNAYRGSGGVASPILNLGTRWRWVVSFTPRPLCLRERTPAPIDWDAGWAPDPVWAFLRSEKFLTLPGNRTRSCPPRSLICVFHSKYLELVHFRVGVLRPGTEESVSLKRAENGEAAV